MLIWVTRGPHNGQFLDLPPELAEQAIAEEWAQDPQGKDHTEMKYPTREHHDAAEAFSQAYDSKGVPRSKEIKDSGYKTREMRAKNPLDSEVKTKKA